MVHASLSMPPQPPTSQKNPFMCHNERNSPTSLGGSFSSSAASSPQIGELSQIFHDTGSSVLVSNSRITPCKDIPPGPVRPSSSTIARIDPTTLRNPQYCTAAARCSTSSTMLSSVASDAERNANSAVGRCCEGTISRNVRRSPL